MNRRLKNRRDLAQGNVMRTSDVIAGRGRRDRSQLLPCLASRPADGPVDGAALVAELVRLAEVGRRAASS